ncbi:MAG: TIM barrel protein [Candidatus Brocadiia bacterium]
MARFPGKSRAGVFPPQLGMKVPLDWRERRRRGQFPRVEGGPYALLARLGFGYVEFPVGVELSGEQPAAAPLEREARACREHGLGVALHPGPGALDNALASWFGPTADCQPAVEPVVDVCAAAARVTGGVVPVVLHPAQLGCRPAAVDEEALREELVRRSGLFFAALERTVREVEPRLRPVAEHQVPPTPEEGIIRIGDTCDELLSVVAGCGIGLCWDTGHYILAVERYGQAAVPPAKFLRRTAHVHLHDVVEGRDHRVISPGSERLREFMRLLRERGFDGWVTLEYTENAIAEAGGPQAALGRTLDALRRWSEE